MLLIAFIVFAILAFIVAIAMFVSSTFANIMLPYYGWPIIGLFYLGALKYAVPPLVTRNVAPVPVCLRGIARTMGIVACFGLVSALIGFTGDNDGNPYLTVHMLQPFWTVCVPLVWIVLLHFAKSLPQAGTDSVTTADRDVVG
ncbi:hypothetical protein SH528x_007335 [Novipirellula sp. SH528]|uniref:hypothetical protein n=1 Tax=Novipirellula sp. SH528 TaxID=3454466 RepID=UPI003FA015D1